MNRMRMRVIASVFAALFLTGCGTARDAAELELVLAGEGRDVPSKENREEAFIRESRASGAWVHICGEVARPGVYEMEAGSRIYDVLEAAGGFTEDADEKRVNLAAEISDGMQVVVPAAGGPADGRGQEGTVNINTASAELLRTLPGIGESRAAAIIDYRETNGPFRAKEDIMKVSGIKQGAYEKIKDLITAG